MLEVKADHLAVIFDAGRFSFRNQIYKDYKAHRPPPPEDLVPQFSLIRHVCRAFNVPCVEIEGYEADDLIATYTKLAKEEDMDVIIVSSDKDLMQLVDDDVIMLDTLKNRVFGTSDVVEKFGVTPDKVVDVQSLAGDSTDNVPGVPGIGIKTAADLINQFGDLETLLARAGEIKQNKRRENLIEFSKAARISKLLVTLKDDVPVTEKISDFHSRPIDMDNLHDFLEEHGFKNLMGRLEKNGLTPTSVAIEKISAKYELVDTIEQLQEWITMAKASGIVAVDTETNSLDPMLADLVGVSLSVKPGHACYIPVGHKDTNSQDLFDGGAQQKFRQIPTSGVVAMLKPLLEDDSVLKVGQNIKYDMLVLKRHGIHISPIDDTMVMSYDLDGSKHGHGMDELAELFLQHETIKYKDVAGRKTFNLVEIEKAKDYAAEDADITLRLHTDFKNRLVKEHCKTIYETIDRPLIPILANMESTGIKVDVIALKKLSKDFTKNLSILEEDIFCIAGKNFNIASPKQLGEILFDHLGIPGGKKSKTGAYGTSVDVLENLSLQGFEIADKIINWRQIAKLKSTYSDSLVKDINPSTGRIHTSYGMTITSTGRLSSSNPNLQNIPIRTSEGIKIRKAFITEPGWKIISLDYSQIELRLLAHMARISKLEEAFHKEIDIHALAASEVYGIPLDKMDHEHRARAKAINFGIIYGISAWGLSKQLGISQEDAAHHIKVYLERYPGIVEYMEKMKARARKFGYVDTLFGRHCYISGILDRIPSRRGFAERQAINAPLQGSNADIIKKAMIKIPGALRDQGLVSRMLLQVHDELVLEAPLSEVEKTIEIVKDIMENIIKLRVPLTVSAGVGDNWADAKS